VHGQPWAFRQLRRGGLAGPQGYAFYARSGGIPRKQDLLKVGDAAALADIDGVYTQMHEAMCEC
jgi:hypothetical protein